MLDIGCNRGGFLRLLADRCAIGEGHGYEPAAAAIADARALAGTRRLQFETSEAVGRWGDFDAAFGHEVLYLLHDLPARAESVFAALRPARPIPVRFVTASSCDSDTTAAHHDDAATGLVEWLDYCYDQKLLLRFTHSTP